MLLFCFFLLGSFFSCTSGKKLQQAKYSADKFVPAVNCMNEDFDLSTYLQIQSQWVQQKSSMFQSSEKPTFPVRFMFNRIMQSLPIKWADRFTSPNWPKYVFGTGHTFAAVGPGLGKRCYRTIENDVKKTADSLEYDENGCVPFTDVTSKLTRLQQCFATFHVDNPNGKWMQRPSPTMEFSKYKVPSHDRLIYRLSQYAGKEEFEGLWEEENDFNFLKEALKTLFDQDQLDNLAIEQTIHCLEAIKIERRDLQCFPVMFGAPGFTGLTVLDHDEEAHEKRKVSHECAVPPACARMAMERLHHFQVMRFDKILFRGVHKTNKLKKGKSWALLNGKIINERCNINPDKIGPTMCWNYTKCLRLMMNQICHENAQCCPNQYVYDKCSSDIRSSKCKVCSHIGKSDSFIVQ